MEFFSAAGLERPKRLSAETRRFAWESLNRKYGKMTLQQPGVALDDVPGLSELSDEEKCDIALMRIAQEAPLRICEGELLSGAATLGLAISHMIPATYRGEAVLPSVSHLTLGFEGVINQGLDHYQARVRAKLREEGLTAQQRGVLLGMDNSVEALRVWHRRYLEALAAKGGAYLANRERLLRVPFGPARHFDEALQSLWFTFAFARLCGNWPGIGRLDAMLGPYLERDLAAGLLTLDQARELLAHFFIKGCEWVCGESWVSGDAQHYQNIVLAGADAQGKDTANAVTGLVLDVVEELGISDFPIAVRLHAGTPAGLIRRMAEVIRHGGGIVAAYNDALVVESMVGFGYPREEALGFANDGCWEVQVPGKTCFTYSPFDGLELLQKRTLGLAGDTLPDYPDFDALYQAFREDLVAQVRAFQEEVAANPFFQQDIPCPFISLLTEDCIERGASYFAGGARYTVRSPHIGGLPDIANALYAIDQLVYREKRVTLRQLLAAVQNNWEGQEELRQYALTHYAYYGNDNDAVDGLAARILADFMAMVRERREIAGVLCPPGVSTFGRQIDWAPSRTASPHGRKRGEILAGNFSPTPATDWQGATAIVRSHCKANLRDLTCGTALDIRLSPATVRGEGGITALESLLRGFVALGGFFVQIDVIDNETLLAARERPQDYPTLSVRVAGWSARFITLNREWQDMIIERNMQGI